MKHDVRFSCREATILDSISIIDIGDIMEASRARIRVKYLTDNNILGLFETMLILQTEAVG